MKSYQRAGLNFLFGALKRFGYHSSESTIRVYLVEGKLSSGMNEASVLTNDQFEKTIELAVGIGLIAIDENGMVLVLQELKDLPKGC